MALRVAGRGLVVVLAVGLLIAACAPDPDAHAPVMPTTHRSVAWTAGGQAGTIPFTQTSTTALLVADIQTLVR